MRIEIDCRHCVNFGQSVFSGIEDDLLQELNDQKSTNLYRKGQVIFFEERVPVGVHCVKSGKVKISRMTADGKEQIVRIVGQGGLLGVKSIVNGTRHSTSAITLEDSQICFIPKALVMNLLSDCNELNSKVMLHLISLLDEAEKKIASLAHKSVRQRLAEVLLLLEQIYMMKDDGKVWICISREDIASLIGTASASVIRLLAEFKEQGYIETNGRQITILNKDALLKQSAV